MERFLDAVVVGAKTVMRRVELGGTLFVAAVIGVLLTSREGFCLFLGGVRTGVPRLEHGTAYMR